MPSCNIRGVVFDMDGVVVDSHPGHRRAWKQFLQSAGRDATDKELDVILDGHKREEILRHFLGDLSPDKITEYGARKDQMLRELDEEIRPMAGVVEFLGSFEASRNSHRTRDIRQSQANSCDNRGTGPYRLFRRDCNRR